MRNWSGNGNVNPFHSRAHLRVGADHPSGLSLDLDLRQGIPATVPGRGPPALVQGGQELRRRPLTAVAARAPRAAGRAGSIRSSWSGGRRGRTSAQLRGASSAVPRSTGSSVPPSTSARSAAGRTSRPSCSPERVRCGSGSLLPVLVAARVRTPSRTCTTTGGAGPAVRPDTHRPSNVLNSRARARVKTIIGHLLRNRVPGQSTRHPASASSSAESYTSLGSARNSDQVRGSMNKLQPNTVAE